MMKKYLLDTNALIRALGHPDELGGKAREIILGDNDILVSDVSLWEIAIKINIGKLDMEGTIPDIEKQCEDLDFERLPIKPGHFEVLRTLPLFHRDPFDRLLISQATVEELAVISSDGAFPKYGVDVVW